MYKLCREEMETTINFCAADDTANIDCADPAVIRKLDRLVKQYPDIYTCTRVDTTCYAKRYTLPARFIRFGKPASAARQEASRRNAILARQTL